MVVGLEKRRHLYNVRYRVEVYSILSLHLNMRLYINHRRLKYNKTIWQRNTGFSALKNN